MLVQGCSYQKSVSHDTAKLGPFVGEYGFIAEDFAKIYPSLVLKDKDGRPESIAYEGYVAVLNEALKELKKEKDSEITELKKRIEVLEKKLGEQVGG
jgi:hypothetical protein